MLPLRPSMLAFASDALLLPPARPRLRPHAGPIGRWRAGAKRGLDVGVALLLLLVLAVPVLLAALAIRLETPGPVLFRQTRIGRHGRRFGMWKLRTMHHQPEPAGPLRQATQNDPRVTRVGAVLRRLSLDEVPQVVNVLRGEMSMVGPRPHAPGTCAGGVPFEQVTERYALRHRVRPGLTGLAQVRGWRGETDTVDKLLRRLDSDLDYIDTWSLWLDLRILARTVLCLLSMRNAW